MRGASLFGGRAARMRSNLGSSSSRDDASDSKARSLLPSFQDSRKGDGKVASKRGSFSAGRRFAGGIWRAPVTVAGALRRLVVALALIWLAWRVLTYRPKVKHYPKLETYRENLPCGTRSAAGFAPGLLLGGEDGAGIGNGIWDEDGGDGGRKKGAIVSLFRTPENACDVAKLVGWMRDLHTQWPWMAAHDHLVLHEADYETCAQDFEGQSDAIMGGNGAGEGRVRCLNLGEVEGAFEFPIEHFQEGYTFPTFTRNLGYMHMCRLFILQLFPHLWDTYEYILRIDDDNMPIQDSGDLFTHLEHREGVYGYAELSTLSTLPPPLSLPR